MGQGVIGADTPTPSVVGAAVAKAAPIRRQLSGRIASTFGSLLLSQILAGGFGFLYWVLAARTFTVDAVAAAAASIAAMLVISTVTNLGLGMLLIIEVPHLSAKEQKRLIQLASAAVTVVTVVVALGFATAAPDFSTVFARAFANATNVTLFVAGTAATAVSLVMDRAVLGLGKNRAQVWRNFLATAIRFPILVVMVLLHSRGAAALVGAWTLALLIAQVVQYWMLHLPRDSDPFAWRAVSADLRRHARSAWGHYVLNLSLGLAPQLIPLLAAVTLTAAVYASFNMVWAICTVLFMVPYSMAVTLLAVASVHGGDLAAHLRKTVRSALALSAASALAGILLGGFVLDVFGGRYAHHGTPLIRLLVLVAIPLVIKDHYFTVTRLRGQQLRSAGIAFLGVVLEMAAAAVGAAWAGGIGLALGWLAAVGFEASLMAPTVVRTMRAWPGGVARVEAAARADAPSPAEAAVARQPAPGLADTA